MFPAKQIFIWRMKNPGALLCLQHSLSGKVMSFLVSTSFIFAVISMLPHIRISNLILKCLFRFMKIYKAFNVIFPLFNCTKSVCFCCPIHNVFFLFSQYHLSAVALRSGVLVPVQISDSRCGQDIMLLNTTLHHFQGRGKGTRSSEKQWPFPVRRASIGGVVARVLPPLLFMFLALVSIFHVYHPLFVHFCY